MFRPVKHSKANPSHNMFSCRSTTQWFSTNTMDNGKMKKTMATHPSPLSFPFPFVQQNLRNDMLFLVDQTKTMPHHYTSRCSTAGEYSNRFQSPHCPEMGTDGSKVGKQAFQPLETRKSSTWEPVVPTLGSMDSNLREDAVPRHGNPCFQGWETWAPTFGAPQFLKRGTREVGNCGSKVGKRRVSRLGNRGWEAWALITLNPAAPMGKANYQETMKPSRH